MNKNKYLVICTGVVVGLAALALTAAGNPANMGFCIACFLRDIAGGLGLHSAEKVQYLRPEIVGLVLGATIAAFASKEFRARAGSAPALRFVLGMIVMVGALAFLGCPLRMVLRLGGGDVTAIAGLIGFAAGIGAGVLCLKKGFSLGRARKVQKADGFVLPGFVVAVLALLLLAPSFIRFSQAGPGASHAPWLISLAGGLVVGVLAQKSRLCMAGGLRDMFLFRDFHLLTGFIAIFVTVLVGNLVLDNFMPPSPYSRLPTTITCGASSVWRWRAGARCCWAAVRCASCILAGEGSGDSAVTVFGMLVGAALAHNFGMAGNADAMTDGVFTAGGVAQTGRIGIVIGLVLLAIISYANLHREEKQND